MPADTIEKLSDHITQIDLGLFGIKRAGAAYLVQAGKSCLIDSGTAAEAKTIVKALDSIDAFPPDMLVLSHSHFDHAQGAPLLCQEAERRGQSLTVMASEKALENLADQSWNRVFDDKHKFQAIPDVMPLTDGQRINLDGLVLEVLDFAGHCADDIALYDAQQGAVFLGDALGYRIEHSLTIPPFMPPFWDPDGFRAAAKRLAGLDVGRLYLAHFGCLEGDEARTFPKEAVETFERWWAVFAEADEAGKLDELPYLEAQLIEQAGVVLPELEVCRPFMKLLLSTINACRRVLAKKSLKVAELQMHGIVEWLVKGYRAHQEQS